MAKKERVLITGGSGRIGTRIIDRLLHSGMEIRVLDIKKVECEGVEFVQGEITSLVDMEKATKNVDTVVHLAGIPVENGDAEGIFNINAGGTFNVLEACARNGVKRFILASSVCVYGVLNPSYPFIPQSLPIDENYTAAPGGNYDTAKVIDEVLCQVYSRRFGIECIAFRIASVVTPESPFWKSAVANIGNPEHELMKGVPAKDFMFQYVHVEDAAQAFVLAIEWESIEPIGFEVFNIGAEDVFSSIPSMELIGKYYPTISALSRPAEFANNKYKTLYDINKAREILGYKPQHTWRELL